MKDNLLPIGSVVLLKDASKRIMVCGFCCKAAKDDGKIYDYVGCLYPEGFISSNKNLLFNHEQIGEVINLGYSDEEEKKFKEKLKTIIKMMNENE